MSGIGQEVSGTGDTPPARGGEMTFLEHLEELRRTILFAIVAVMIGTVAAWNVVDRLLPWFARDVERLYSTALTEGFSVRLKLAMLIGTLAALPFILTRLWRFVVPGLMPGERRLVGPLVAVSVALFYGGVAFALLAVKPMVVRFFLQYARPPYLVPLIGVGSYFDFVVRLALAFGVVFQMPLVICVLSVAGVVTPGGLARQWRYAVVAAFIAGAIFTPPDVVSQIAMSVPLVALYFIGVGAAAFIVRRRPSIPRPTRSWRRAFRLDTR